MSKNSSKAPPLRHPADGAPVPAELSPALRGGDGRSGVATAEEALAFRLERVDIGVLSQLRPGFAIRFVEESKADISAAHGGKIIGNVPRRHVARVKQMMLGFYSAEVQGLSHDSVEVRITA